jgi:hypothetical protein
MLENDPPPGTIVKFMREVRKARMYDTAILVRASRKYLTETADDDYEVEFRGERMIVKRQDIEKVYL